MDIEGAYYIPHDGSGITRCGDPLDLERYSIEEIGHALGDDLEILELGHVQGRTPRIRMALIIDVGAAIPNPIATWIAYRPIFGNAILCRSELAPAGLKKGWVLK